ncbi:MFS transporter [Plantactinospora solaniradicis]|uniref:MFS transporter n=1 Tax=Plantactinospora solaniradicis TaxID=1723736 RepID=A0ABW1KIB9_9ACTN
MASSAPPGTTPLTTTNDPAQLDGTTDGTPAGGPRMTARLWGALIVLCGALFLDGLDVSMVGVALPSIQADLGLSNSALQWIVSGYVLGYGGLLLLGGRTADLLGRRQVFLWAIAVFGVASLVGGLVDDPSLLIATRFAKGVAAAFTAPAGLSIITTTFHEGPARNRALSFYTACGASGFSLGLVFGGVLTEAGWRWTFLLPAPIALLVLFAGIRLIPTDRTPRRAGGYDLGGAATATAALLLLVYAVVSAPTAGWLSVRTVGSFALVAALLAAFVQIERRVAHPLVRLSILGNRSLVGANLAALAVTGSYVGFQFIGTLYTQVVLGWSPLDMALAFLPGGLIVAFGGPRVGNLVNRFGTGRVVMAGFAAFLAAYLLFLRIDGEPRYLGVILPTMLLVGTGFALAFPALNIQATAGVADEEQGLASGLVQTSFQVGGAIVLAGVTAVLATDQPTPGHVPDSFYPAVGLVSGVALLGLLVAAVTGSRARGRHRGPVHLG